MWTDAIELGVIAFLAHGEADDGAVQDWLEALGSSVSGRVISICAR
jgi:hypothetical protein